MCCRWLQTLQTLRPPVSLPHRGTTTPMPAALSKHGPGPRNSEFTGKNHSRKHHLYRSDEDQGLFVKFNLPEKFLLK